MADILVISWSAYGGGRARALLSLTSHLADTHRVRVAIGARAWDYPHLVAHHDVDPLRVGVDWRPVNWGRDGIAGTVADLVAETDPDAVLSFDGCLHTAIRHLNRPTISYNRTHVTPGCDEAWAPSQMVADEFTTELEGRGEGPCRAMYPVWYLDGVVTGRQLDDRPIDVMVHGRKARDAVAELNPDYTVLLANRFSYPELQRYYRQTRTFLFPRPERLEPLGLMPIEAAAHGCRVAIPPNCGAAEVLPDAVFEDPTAVVREDITAPPHVADPVPESPTDPADRIHALTD